MTTDPRITVAQPCTCPRGFGGAFRFHRHPCPNAGRIDREAS